MPHATSNTPNRIAALFLIALSALPPAESRAAGWTPDLTVSTAFVEGNTDLVVIVTSGGGTYASGCQANSWIFAADTDARRSRAYATVLAALASGKKIRLWYGDTCAAWNYHAASSVMLVN